jgi:hypothetical protein
MKLASIFLFLLATTRLFAQWEGTYYGVVNGDNIVVTLEQSGDIVTGSMQDSYQTFGLEGTILGQELIGSATENTLYLEFEFYATKVGNRLECTLAIGEGDERLENAFSVEKEGARDNGISVAETAVSSDIPFPSGATFPASLVGQWVQNETYNSGSGDNFMGANFSQSMTFYSDGTLSEGGSSASMSGSNYSGQSSGEGSGKLEGIGWYAKQKNLYVIVFNEGSWTSVFLGTWFTENGHLLITGENGNKLLLSR